MAFTPIETQDDFDRAIAKRLAQKEQEMTAKFAGYTSPDDLKKLQADQAKAIETAKQNLADMTTRATKAEGTLLRHKVATEKHIPLALADRLVGSTEEELSKDAETLAGLIGESKPTVTPPPFTSSPANQAPNSTDAALKEMLAALIAPQS